MEHCTENSNCTGIVREVTSEPLVRIYNNAHVNWRFVVCSVCPPSCMIAIGLRVFLHSFPLEVRISKESLMYRRLWNLCNATEKAVEHVHQEIPPNR